MYLHTGQFPWGSEKYPTESHIKLNHYSRNQQDHTSTIIGTLCKSPNLQTQKGLSPFINSHRWEMTGDVLTGLQTQ